MLWVKSIVLFALTLWLAESAPALNSAKQESADLLNGLEKAVGMQQQQEGDDDYDLADPENAKFVKGLLNLASLQENDDDFDYGDEEAEMMRAIAIADLASEQQEEGAMIDAAKMETYDGDVDDLASVEGWLRRVFGRRKRRRRKRRRGGFWRRLGRFALRHAPKLLKFLG